MCSRATTLARGEHRTALVAVRAASRAVRPSLAADREPNPAPPVPPSPRHQAIGAAAVAVPRCCGRYQQPVHQPPVHNGAPGTLTAAFTNGAATERAMA